MVKLKLTLLALAAWLSVSVGHAEDSVYVYRYSGPVNVYSMEYLDSIWADQQRQRLCFSLPKDIFEKVPDGPDTNLPDIEWDPETTDEQKDIIRRILDNLVMVEGGYMLMGAQRTDNTQPNYYQNAEACESPVHRVFVSSFRMNRYELTAHEYDVITSSPRAYMSPDDYRAMGGLSWNQAKELIDHINHLCHIPGYKFSMPTEAQWEFAARGGNQSHIGYMFSGSNVATQVGWIVTNSNMIIHEVGKLLPNDLGIYDMTGNVYEWCSDWYGDYSAEEATDPHGPTDGSLKVCRGGCYMTPESTSRNSHRMNYPPDATTVIVLNEPIPAGIRLVLDYGETEHYLTLTPNEITAAADGGTYCVDVQTDESFYVVNQPSWCHIETSPGQICITVEGNLSGSERTGSIEVATASSTARVNIVQASVPYVYVSPELPTPEDLINRIVWSNDLTQAQEGTILQMVRNMVCVAGDEYYMGAQKDEADGINYDPNAKDDELPVHKVRLSSFYLSKYQMTRNDYRVIMGNDPSYFQWSWKAPVENLSWSDANAFVEKINQLCGLKFCLPTEAQWEYAARGGREGHRQGHGYIFSGSNNSQEVGWTAANANQITHDVGTLKANELGIYDMTGNTFEWCQDYYENAYREMYSGTQDGYSSTPIEWNPVKSINTKQKVARGGCHILPDTYARNAARLSYDPESHTYLGYTLPAGVRPAISYEAEINLTPSAAPGTTILDISALGDEAEVVRNYYWHDEGSGNVYGTESWCNVDLADGKVTIRVNDNFIVNNERLATFYINTYKKRLKVVVNQEGLILNPGYYY